MPSGEHSPEARAESSQEQPSEQAEMSAAMDRTTRTADTARSAFDQAGQFAESEGDALDPETRSELDGLRAETDQAFSELGELSGEADAAKGGSPESQPNEGTERKEGGVFDRWGFPSMFGGKEPTPGTPEWAEWLVRTGRGIKIKNEKMSGESAESVTARAMAEADAQEREGQILREEAMTRLKDLEQSVEVFRRAKESTSDPETIRERAIQLSELFHREFADVLKKSNEYISKVDITSDLQVHEGMKYLLTMDEPLEGMHRVQDTIHRILVEHHGTDLVQPGSVEQNEETEYLRHKMAIQSASEDKTKIPLSSISGP